MGVLGYSPDMDDLVKAALVKWPNVPACFGWLGLDARGQWWMRDDAAQRCGPFGSNSPGAKGSVLRHDKLIEFIGRNYDVEPDGPLSGAWFFQNGPQKVYVELESTPWIWRVSKHSNSFEITSHTGQPVHLESCHLCERGWLYLLTDVGFGLIHSQDVFVAAQAIESGAWEPVLVNSTQLEALFGFARSPQSRHNELAFSPMRR